MKEKEILQLILSGMSQVQCQGVEQAKAYLECMEYLDKKIKEVKE